MVEENVVASFIIKTKKDIDISNEIPIPQILEQKQRIMSQNPEPLQ